MLVAQRHQRLVCAAIPRLAIRLPAGAAGAEFTFRFTGAFRPFDRADSYLPGVR